MACEEGEREKEKKMAGRFLAPSRRPCDRRKRGQARGRKDTWQNGPGGVVVEE